MAILPRFVSAEYRGRMRSHSMDGMLEEANRLLSLGDLDHAERLLKEILQQDARMAPALTLSGVIAYLRGSSEAAIELMNRALAINPDDPVAYVTCGQAYRALGNLPAAEQSLRHALRLEPGRHDAHLNLALTLWSAGEHARAGTYFKNALLMGKKSFQAYFYLGQLIEMAVRKGRGKKRNLKIGICGEHGGDPATVEFCHRMGLDYVSCSPYRVPIARLAAAHARIKESSS